MSFAAAMVIALAIDAAIGWPDALYRRIGHPVTWIGALIAGLERQFNQSGRSQRHQFWAGCLSTGTVVSVSAVVAALLTWPLPDGWLGTLMLGVLAWPLVATRSMHDHVAAVVRPLAQGDLPAARAAVAMIVGRDPSGLDAPAVARATLESLAENSSDGIVAPVFWGAVAGLPGIAAYKAINTLDSMIGHRSARYLFFGRAAARIDDLVNLIPARLTGGLFALVSGQPRAALRSMARDAHHHRSPNAGWPEAAMAGALGVRLSGPRSYDGALTDDPFVNPGHPDPGPQDIARGLALFRRSMLCLGLGLALIALV